MAAAVGEWPCHMRAQSPPGPWQGWTQRSCFDAPARMDAPLAPERGCRRSERSIKRFLYYLLTLASLSNKSPWQGSGAHQQTKSRPRSSCRSLIRPLSY